MAVPKSDFSIDDFIAFPVWREDPESELYWPLDDLSIGIDGVEDLYFRGVMEASSGHRFDGIISGLGDVAITIHNAGSLYTFNVNFIDWNEAMVDKMVRDDPRLSDGIPLKLFPVQFWSKIEMEPFLEFQGVFDPTAQSRAGTNG